MADENSNPFDDDAAGGQANVPRLSVGTPPAVVQAPAGRRAPSRREGNHSPDGGSARKNSASPDRQAANTRPPSVRPPSRRKPKRQRLPRRNAALPGRPPLASPRRRKKSPAAGSGINH